MLLLKLLYRPRSQSTVEVFAAKAGITGRCEHLHTAHRTVSTVGTTRMVWHAASTSKRRATHLEHAVGDRQ